MLVLTNLHALCSTKIFTQQNSAQCKKCVQTIETQVIFEAVNTSKREEQARQPISSCIGVSNSGQIGVRCAVLVASLFTSQTCDAIKTGNLIGEMYKLLVLDLLMLVQQM